MGKNQNHLIASMDNMNIIKILVMLPKKLASPPPIHKVYGPCLQLPPLSMPFLLFALCQ
jgi:hypothetical protein